MAWMRCDSWPRLAVCVGLVFLLSVALAVGADAPEEAPAPRPVIQPPQPGPETGERPLPINLATALRLANARPLDIALATQRVGAAIAQLEQARVLWVPTVLWGADYFRHDGQIQAVDGSIFGTSKGALFLGGAPQMVVGLNEALFGPLIARQNLRSRQADRQAARNNTLQAVARAYFAVQQSRGELAGAVDTARRTETLVQRAEKLAPGLVPPVEAIRARAELRERRQEVQRTRERWRVASADLARLLLLDPSTLVEPLEPPHLRVNLLNGDRPMDELLSIALTNRPELASQQAQVRVMLTQMRKAKLAPFVPSLYVRSAAANSSGTLGFGAFGGGVNSTISNFSARSDWDVTLLWGLQNLGFGNRAQIHESQANHRAAQVELVNVQTRVAADVTQAEAHLRSAALRYDDALHGLEDAVTSFNLNLEGLSQTKRAGNLLVLVIRPQEVVAAVQALSRAYANFYGAVADFNQAQFLLYWALGQPAQALITLESNVAPPPNAAPPPAAPTPNPVQAAAPPEPPLFEATRWSRTPAKPFVLNPPPTPSH